MVVFMYFPHPPGLGAMAVEQDMVGSLNPTTGGTVKDPLREGSLD